MNIFDLETTLHVIAVYIFECLEYGLHLSVGEMVDICKAYRPDEAEKESDTVKKNRSPVRNISLCRFTSSSGTCSR